MAEHGITIPQGANRFEREFPAIFASYWEKFSGAFQAVLKGNSEELERFNNEIQKIDELIQLDVQQSEKCKSLMTISGFGPIIALALFSQAGSGIQFKNGRQMSAYFGITPKGHFSGGKQRLLGITKRGNIRIRVLLVIAARDILTGISRRKRDEMGLPLRLSIFDKWAMDMKERLGVFKATVAIANKLCRIAWAVLAKMRFSGSVAKNLLWILTQNFDIFPQLWKEEVVRLSG